MGNIPEHSNKEDTREWIKVSPYELINLLLRRIESLESAIESLKETIDELANAD